MTRTIRSAPGDAATSRGGGVDDGDPDTRKNHKVGEGASPRRLPSLAPICGGPVKPRSVVLGQIAINDRETIKVSILPNGKATAIDVRVYTRSAGLFFPSERGVTMPVAAAAFVVAQLKDIKKTVKKLLEAGA